MNLLRLLATLVCGGSCLSLACGAAAPPLPHLDLQIELDPGTRHFRAVAEFPCTRRCRLVLHESLTVSAMHVNGRPVQLPPAQHSAGRRIWPVDAPAHATLRIEYGGTLPALDRSLDHRDVLQIRTPMAGTEGSFLAAGVFWYPEFAARFTYRVKLSLPGDQRGLVAGRLVAESLPENTSGRYSAEFEFLQPAEGIDLMAGPYVVSEHLVPRDGLEPLRLRTYFYRDMESLAAGYLDDTRRYIELYSGQIGAYPFSEFSVVAGPLPTGFGMPTLTYIGAEVLKLPFIRATSLGHEVLHNWWGNGVLPDYATGNWSEGLTTFMADYFYKERESAVAAREMRMAWLRDFAAVPAGRHQSLASFKSRTHGAAAAVGYGKSAMVFFMLRDAIGDDAFRQGIQLFWTRHRFTTASWEDLRAAFEAAAGRPLKIFFEQWVGRSGGPRLRIDGASVAAESGKSSLALTLAQTTPPYVLSVPVEITMASRTQMRRVATHQAQEVARLDLDAVPETVRLDPDLRLWRVLDASELPPILRQWIIARSPAYAMLSSGAELQAAAEQLTRSLFEAPARLIEIPALARETEPVLLIGLHGDVDAALAQRGFAPRPQALRERGSAQVWTVREDERSQQIRAPVAVISVSDAAALAALLRPLPHYGGQSYLIFEGSRAIERGVWPGTGRTIPVELAADRRR